MNVHDAFATRTQPAAPNAEPLGQLFVMRCEPDPFTGERLNVGVFGVDRSGRRVARVVQQVGRLECLYGPAAAEVVWLAAAAKEAALAGVASPSPQVVFGGPMAFLHGTLEQAVDRAFAELVTVALPHKVREASGTKFTDEDALASVSDSIKKLIGLDFGLLANTPNVLVETDRGPWTVMVPFQPSEGVGTIRSADYSPATLKTHLMDSVLDLECAASYRNKRGQGLFLLRQTEVPQSEAKAIDAVVDSVLHRASRKLHFDVGYSAGELAQRIVQWSEELQA